MKIIFQLSLIAILPVVVSIILYLIDKKTKFKQLNSKIKQVIYGVIFGGIAIFATEFGVDVGGAVANVRDAAALIAGLVFGAPAGLIAGLIGGIERWFAVFWGAGEYTRLACTISTILAGVIGAVLRKYMFDDKKPSWGYALGIGIITEVLHMLMIFITNMQDIKTAFEFVEKCSIPMITVNGLSVMIAVLVITIIGKERIINKKVDKQISTQFQHWLLLCVVVAIAITSVFTMLLQNSLSNNDTNNLLKLNLEDIKADISDASDDNLLELTHEVKDQLTSEVNITNEILTTIATANSIAEINIIDKVMDDVVITFSTNPEYINFSMKNGGKQSAEFLVLFEGVSEYVQSYQATANNADVYCKYAAVLLSETRFVQVGYDVEHFQADIADVIDGITSNRHIGENGCIIIVNDENEIVSARHDYEGQIFSSAPVEATEGVRFTMNVYGEDSYCMYIENEGYKIISVIPIDEANFSRNISIYVMLFMELLIFVCLFVLIYFLIKTLVVNNIRKVNASLSKITEGNLNVTIDVRTNEEFSSLSDDINSTVVTLKRYIAEAAARIDKELEFAKSIQHSALPSVFPPFPNRTDFDIYALMDAAKEVGGDFYDFYFTDNNDFVILIADVSGKGIPAAMFMMRAKALIKGYAEAGKSVEEVLTLANEKLCEGNDAEMFVTAWMGKINLQTGMVTYSNAGHNPPLIKRLDGKYEYLRSRAGFVLGGMEGIKYSRNEIQLNVGESLFLYTDGVTEATNVNEELYGEDRLQNILNNAPADLAKELCEIVIEDVDKFVGEAPQFDDITMLCLKYKGDSKK